MASVFLGDDDGLGEGMERGVGEAIHPQGTAVTPCLSDASSGAS